MSQVLLDGGVDLGAAQLLPESVCRAMGIVAYGFDGETLLIASAKGDDQMTARLARGLADRPVRLVPTDAAEVTRTIDTVFPGSRRATSSPAGGSPTRTSTASAAGTPSAPANGITAATANGATAAPANGTPAPTPLRDPSVPPRVGERLIDLSLVSQDQVDAALAEQARSGGKVGDILVHSGALTESNLVAVLSEHLDVQHVDLAGHRVDEEIASRIPEPLARELGVVPVALSGGALWVATPTTLSPDARYLLEQAAETDVRELLATRSSIAELNQAIYGERHVEISRTGLLESRPEESAHVVATKGQLTFFAVAAVTTLVCLVIWTTSTLIALTAMASLFYLAVSVYRFRLVLLAIAHKPEFVVSDEQLDELDELTLPVYTLLLPLYKEANIVGRLTAGIDALDYPKTKLDVKLLCEEDDLETIDAIRALGLPPHYELVIVPDSLPKTKPKACNYGLLSARGEYCVIYDGEDRPDPQQLKKAVIAFRTLPENVACIQAKLNYFNRDQNVLTKWFAIEYAMHFELVLPGLDRDGVPIPLGGTSNHFRTDLLRELGAWDPYNVTEDADLGVRLHKSGHRCAVMDSTTLEEANSDVGNWIRQRSRWCKGYYQTWLVHMRNPVKLLRQLGLKSFISFNLVVGGAFVFLLNPIFWAMTTLFIITESTAIQTLFPGFVFYAAAAMLFLGNFTFLYMNLAGALQRGFYGLARYALLSPIYWGLISWAAWKGAIQLVTNPFYWEKTIHGLDEGHQE